MTGPFKIVRNVGQFGKAKNDILRPRRISAIGNC
jgi:hypothetical protein